MVLSTRDSSSARRPVLSKTATSSSFSCGRIPSQSAEILPIVMRTFAARLTAAAISSR